MLSLEEIENNLDNKKINYKKYIILLKTIFFSLLIFILHSKSFNKILINIKILKYVSNNLIIIVLFGLFFYIIEYYIY